MLRCQGQIYSLTKARRKRGRTYSPHTVETNTKITSFGLPGLSRLLHMLLLCTCASLSEYGFLTLSVSGECDLWLLLRQVTTALLSSVASPLFGLFVLGGLFRRANWKVSSKQPTQRHNEFMHFVNTNNASMTF